MKDKEMELILNERSWATPGLCFGPVALQKKSVNPLQCNN